MKALTCTHVGVTVILKGDDSRIAARHSFASATRTSAYNAKSASMNLNSRCYSGLSALLAKPDQEADTKRASMVNAESGRQLPDTLQRPEFKPYAQIHGMGRGHKNSPRPRGILTWKESYSCQKYGLCESITANATRQYNKYAPALNFKLMLAMLDTIQAENAVMIAQGIPSATRKARLFAIAAPIREAA